MEQLARGIKRLIGLTMVAAMLVMVILVFTNVVLRYGFSSGIAASEEIVRHLFVWVTFLGAILGVIEGAHIGVDSLINALPEAGRKVCSIVTGVIIVGCCILLLHGCWQQALINMDNLAPVSGIPVGLMYWAGVLASFSIGLVTTWRIVASLVCHARLTSPPAALAELHEQQPRA